MKTIRLDLLTILWALLGLPLIGYADDIDIYSGGSANTGVPNVLLVMDTGANFSGNAAVPCAGYTSGGLPSLGGSTNAGVEQCALVDAIDALPLGTVNVGLMVYNANNFTDGAAADVGPCVGSDGGCLVKPLTLMTATGKSNLINFIKSWTSSGSNSATQFNVKTNNEKTGSAMQEAWAYYNGKIGMSGKDYGNPIAGVGCQHNFIIFVGNSFSNSSGPGDPVPDPDNSITGLTSPQVGATALQKIKLSNTVKFSTTTCGVDSLAASTNSSNWSENWADEWARYMQQTDFSSSLDGKQNIVTYTIGVINNGTNTCKPDYPALLSNMASYGGGKYYQTGNATDITKALLSILNEVQAVNSAFSSSSLPVSVNAQGTYLNQIYMGMFRPDASANPRWLGNLKQYQFIVDSTGSIKLGDSTGALAISSAGTGFISPNAVSFWTTKNTAAPDSTGGFWVNNQQGVGMGYDSPDGEFVEKGGAAQQLRLANLKDNYATNPGSPRNLYTFCPSDLSGASCFSSSTTNHLSASSNAFATTNTSLQASAFGASASELTSLINWVRGEDNKTGDEQGPGSPYTVRPSIHGDVLHSRPVVINYGGTTGVVVFYGGNDGVYRAINGNQTSAIGSTPAGGELWGVVLPEHFSKLKRQRDNSPALKLPSTPSGITPAPQQKDYFIDGETGVYQTLNTDGTIAKAYIYPTMRRGGRFIYAIDVTNPADPKVLWKKSNTDFSELGQTWSRPRIALLKGYVDAAGKSKPVLIFGAGYDPAAEDVEPPASDTMGRGIFIVDAVTGSLVKSFTNSSVTGMNYSIPSDVTLIDRDHDGKIDRLYVGDTGGNIWRVDFEPAAGTAPANWQIIKLAALGCDAGVCGSNVTPRKFFYPPSVVTTGIAGASGSFDAVLLGSGDREHPLATNTANQFYMLTDTNTGKDGSSRTTPIVQSALKNVSNTSLYDGTLSGFYFSFGNGEKAVNAPLTAGGITFFGTNQPSTSSTSCSANLGIARGYSVDPFTGQQSSTKLDGGGLPPSPTAGMVTIANGKPPVHFCIGCVSPVTTGTNPKPPCNSAIQNCYNDQSGAAHINRTYWYKN